MVAGELRCRVRSRIERGRGHPRAAWARGLAGEAVSQAQHSHPRPGGRAAPRRWGCAGRPRGGPRRRAVVEEPCEGARRRPVGAGGARACGQRLPRVGGVGVGRVRPASGFEARSVALGAPVGGVVRVAWRGGAVGMGGGDGGDGGGRRRRRGCTPGGGDCLRVGGLRRADGGRAARRAGAVGGGARVHAGLAAGVGAAAARRIRGLDAAPGGRGQRARGPHRTRPGAALVGGRSRRGVISQSHNLVDPAS